MKLRARVAERVEDKEAAQRRIQAEQLADVAFPPPHFEPEERDTLQAAITSAQIRRPGYAGFQEELRIRLPKLAADLGRKEDEVQRQLAEMLTIARRRQEWLTANGVDEEDSPDSKAQAEAILAWILRRRDGLELRLQDRHLSRLSRHRMEAELVELEKQENEHWSVIHPPYIPGRPLNPREAYCRCGAVMTKAARFTLGACDECRTHFQLRTGKPYPTINV